MHVRTKTLLKNASEPKWQGNGRSSSEWYVDLQKIKDQPSMSSTSGNYVNRVERPP